MIGHLLLLAACSSGDGKKPVSDACVLNSDCATGLTCTFGRCHTTCVNSQDCPLGATCVNSAAGTAVCQLPAEASCSNDSGCPLPLVCGIDQNCRGTCHAAADCPSGQKCANQNLCADPAQVNASNDLVGKSDGGIPGNDGAAGQPDVSLTAADAPRAEDGASGTDAGTADGAIDAPGSGGASGSDGATGSGGSTGGSCPGQAPTNFGHMATGDSNPKYTSGVGVRTATEFVVFSGYVGPGASGIDAGASPGTVNRIDVQHFDLTTGASKGRSAQLLIAAGDGTGLSIDGAAVAPTGEVAIVYSAATSAPGAKYGDYVEFLDKDLTPRQSTQIVALGLDQYADQGHVQWLNGKFVASVVVNNATNATVKIAKFTADGTNAGSTSTIPTDDPSGNVSVYNNNESETAYSGGLYAVGYLTSTPMYAPYVTILDSLGTEVGAPVKLPSALGYYGNTAGTFVSIAGTSQGFVAVYNGASASNVASLLATFLSNSAPVDAGTVPVGATRAFPGGYAYGGSWSARGSSDGVGAGFAVLYPDGSVSFIYFNASGDIGTSPQAVLQQTGTASAGDEVQITNFGGSFVVSLYSSGEHLTRMVGSSCQ